MKGARYTMMLALGSMLLLGAGCGQQGEPVQTAPREPAESGEALAQEILATFDEMVAKAAALAEDKPEGEVLRPQLLELYAEYEAKMTALNERFLALRENEPREFGNANSYMHSNRGRHVSQRDHTLAEALRHYNHQVGDRETVEMLSSRASQVLDIAVRM